MKFEVFRGFFEEKFTFWNVSWNWINYECFTFCTFLSREFMMMIDTTLESLDVLFFDDKILGITGVSCVIVIFHLWLRVKCFIQQFDWMNVIFGYHAYQYGTQNYSSGKVWYLCTKTHLVYFIDNLILPGGKTPFPPGIYIYLFKVQKKRHTSRRVSELMRGR